MRVLITVVVMRTKGDNVCRELNTVLTRLLNDEVSSESKCLISQYHCFFNPSLVRARFLLYCHILWEYINSTLCAYFGEGNGTPLQYSCLENPMDGGAW